MFLKDTGHRWALHSEVISSLNLLALFDKSAGSDSRMGLHRRRILKCSFAYERV